VCFIFRTNGKGRGPERRREGVWSVDRLDRSLHTRMLLAFVERRAMRVSHTLWLGSVARHQHALVLRFVSTGGVLLSSIICVRSTHAFLTRFLFSPPAPYIFFIVSLAHTSEAGFSAQYFAKALAKNTLWATPAAFFTSVGFAAASL